MVDKTKQKPLDSSHNEEDGRWKVAYLKAKNSAGMIFTRVNMMDTGQV